MLYTLSLHDALPILAASLPESLTPIAYALPGQLLAEADKSSRSEEHTSELQSRENLVCRLLLEKKKGIGLIPCKPCLTFILLEVLGNRAEFVTARH